MKAIFHANARNVESHFAQKLRSEAVIKSLFNDKKPSHIHYEFIKIVPKFNSAWQVRTKGNIGCQFSKGFS